MEEILELSMKKSKELFEKEAMKIVVAGEIPKLRGAYLIRQNGIVVYIGESGNLRVRLNDHCSGENGNTTSGTFRNSVAKEKGIPFGRELGDYIRENYCFVWIEVENKDICHLVEAVSIVHARRENPSLLNK